MSNATTRPARRGTRGLAPSGIPATALNLSFGVLAATVFFSGMLFSAIVAVTTAVSG